MAHARAIPLLTALALAACAGPQTTALRADDLQSTAAEMSAKLQAADIIRTRSPDSPPMVIAINKVENLTSDVIPSSQQWYMMAKVRDSLPIAGLRSQRQVYFVIPAEHLRDAESRGTLPPDLWTGRKPTHEMSATFRSARRASGVDQTDAYDCEFRLTDLASGELQWTDVVSFKRTASGRSYD